jgi:hypothetical protein
MPAVYRAVRPDRYGAWNEGDTCEVIGRATEAGDTLVCARFTTEELEISERLFHISFTKIRDGYRS